MQLRAFICIVLCLLFFKVESVQAATALTNKNSTSQLLLKQPQVQNKIQEIAFEKYKITMQQWILNLSNLAKKSDSAYDFFTKIYQDTGYLSADDIKFLKEKLGQTSAPVITPTSVGFEFKIASEILNVSVLSKLGDTLMNKQQIEPIDLSVGLKKLVDDNLKKQFSQSSQYQSTLFTLFSLAKIQKAHAVVPLLLVAAAILTRHIVIGVVTGATVGAVGGAVAGCYFGPSDHVTDKKKLTALDKCLQGAQEGALVASKDFAATFGSLGAVGGLAALWHGDAGMFFWRNRDITPDEIPKLRKFLKIGGVLSVLAGVEAMASAYGVRLQCDSDGTWRLESMKAGAVDKVIAVSGCQKNDRDSSACLQNGTDYKDMINSLPVTTQTGKEELTQAYKNYLLKQKSDLFKNESLINFMASTMAQEHTDRDQFCKANPGKSESATWNMSSLLKVSMAPTSNKVAPETDKPAGGVKN